MAVGIEAVGGDQEGIAGIDMDTVMDSELGIVLAIEQEGGTRRETTFIVHRETPIEHLPRLIAVNRKIELKFRITGRIMCMPTAQVTCIEIIKVAGKNAPIKAGQIVAIKHKQNEK